MTTIKVTQKHIDDGDIYSCRRCPVALAIGAKTLSIPWVGTYGIEFYESDKRDVPPEIVFLPDKVRSFIAAFDKGKPVYPFSFKLRIPTKFLARGDAAEGKG